MTANMLCLLFMTITGLVARVTQTYPCWTVLELSTLCNAFLWPHVIVRTVNYYFVLVYMHFSFYHYMPKKHALNIVERTGIEPMLEFWKRLSNSLTTVIILLIYVNKMYVTLYNASSGLTSTSTFQYILAIQANNEPTTSNYK